MTDIYRQHLGSLDIVGDAGSFPSHAELVRTLLGHGGYATLTTLTDDGHPYGSLVAYSVLADGSPLVCISEIAEHTRNARRNAAGGLFVAAPAVPDVDPMDAARVSLVGELAPYDAQPDEIDLHLAVQPGAAAYHEWDDFGWWRLSISSARYVGGFGIMSWIDGDAIAAAQPDPVAAASAAAVAHMNADHADANLAIVRHLGGATAATAARVRDIDRLGVTFAVDAGGAQQVVRVPFVGGALTEADQVRAAVVELTHRARAASDGDA